MTQLATFSATYIRRHDRKLEWKALHGSELAGDSSWMGILILQFAHYTGDEEHWVVAHPDTPRAHVYKGYDGYKSTRGEPMNLPLSDTISVYKDGTVGPRNVGSILAPNYSEQFGRLWRKYMGKFLDSTQQPPTSFYQSHLPPEWTMKSNYWPGSSLKGCGTYLTHRIDFEEPIHFKENHDKH